MNEPWENIMKLDIYLHKSNGVWGWREDYISPPSVRINNVDVTLIQNGFRILSLQTTKMKYKALFSFALDIIKLVQIGEGFFHNIDSIKYIESNENEPICKKKDDLKKEDFIDFYNTYCNFVADKLELVTPAVIVTQQNYLKWKDLYLKLTIQHNAFLYYSTDNGLPINLRMANLIELCEPLAEFTCSDEVNKDCNLKNCIRQLVIKYGQDIFKKEIEAGCFDFKEKTENGNSSILQKLVNTRVNILHYKLEPKECFSNELERVIYCNKMHLLYRAIILKYLEIPVCSEKLRTATNYVESRLAGFDFDNYISNY